MSYHCLGALYEGCDCAFQVGIFSWSISEDKYLRRGWSCCQRDLKRHHMLHEITELLHPQFQ